MDLTIEIPDELARHLAAAPGDLSCRVVETIALEEFKSAHHEAGAAAFARLCNTRRIGRSP